MSSADPLPSAEAAGLILAVEQADSAAALLGATAALAGRLGGSAEPPAAAIRTLVEVLGFNNPGAAVAAVDGLIACGEAAVEPLLMNLDAHNYGARAWAVRALAGIGDVRGLELLEQALANDIGPSVRRAAARGLGQLRCDGLRPPERHAVRGRALTALETAGADGEWVVRYAVVVGLESLALSLAGDTGSSGGPISSSGERPPAADSGAMSMSAASLHARARQALQRHGDDAEAIAVVRLRARQALGRLSAPPR